MENKYKLERNEAEEIFKKDIIPYLFSHATPSDSPKFFLVGGQPGSGKTELVIHSKSLLKNNYVTVDGDLLRKFHPKYEEINDIYGADASKYTHPDCARWSIWAIRKAREEGYNVILENTLRDRNILDTIELFSQKCYDVTVKVMVVTDLESTLGIFQRFFDALITSESVKIIPRYTSISRHDETTTNIPNTIDEIQKQNLSTIELFRRGTDGVEKIAIPKEVDSIKDYYLKCKDYPYTKEELEYIKTEILKVKNLLDMHISSLECQNDFKLLEDAAKNIIF